MGVGVEGGAGGPAVGESVGGWAEVGADGPAVGAGATVVPGEAVGVGVGAGNGVSVGSATMSTAAP